MTERNDRAPEFLTVLPDPALFRAARIMQRICIAIAIVAALWELLQSFGSAHDAALASLPVLLETFACALSLLLSEPNRLFALPYVRRSAKILVLFGAAVVLFWIFAIASPANPLHAAAPPARVPAGFLLLALTVILVDNAHWLVNRAADGLVCALCLLSLLLVSDTVFASSALFGRSSGTQTSIAVLVCLAALTTAVTLRQAEHGVLSIFLGVGNGPRLARVFTPILLILTFVWQALSTRVSGPLGAALVGALAVAFSVGILLYFSWRISRMENEIHDLVLRDESTRLYNPRGFHMLAEHALRLAKRTNVPFSVLFIELENLADIHAQHGNDATAASLAEAGEILRATFREVDIKGRLGADEFAVAGRFDRCGIAVAAMRLEAATAARTSRTQGPVPLKISMGHVTTVDSSVQETLKDLLQRAGQAKNRLDFQISEMHVN
jgi:diguanylate cyclase (GGDEF)-like protein